MLYSSDDMVDLRARTGIERAKQEGSCSSLLRYVKEGPIDVSDWALG
jgi:hypothetical protein